MWLPASVGNTITHHLGTQLRCLIRSSGLQRSRSRQQVPACPRASSAGGQAQVRFRERGILMVVTDHDCLETCEVSRRQERAMQINRPCTCRFVAPGQDASRSSDQPTCVECSGRSPGSKWVPTEQGEQHSVWCLGAPTVPGAASWAVGMGSDANCCSALHGVCSATGLWFILVCSVCVPSAPAENLSAIRDS